MNTKIPDSIEVKEWWRPGNGMMYNVWALDPEHPQHPYQQIVAMGLIPEDYGIDYPEDPRFESMSRGALIAEIKQLRKDILGAAKHGFF